MRPVLRTLLLIAGSMAILATTPRWKRYKGLQTHEVTVLALAVRAEQTYVRPWDLFMIAHSGAPSRAPAKRVVGILSRTNPSLLEPNPLVMFDTQAPYTPGQQVGTLGTVAFVIDIPIEKWLSAANASHLLLTSGTQYLTVFLQDADPSSSEFAFGLGASEGDCDCDLTVSVDARYSPPDASGVRSRE
jgi:hypothetical protein